MLFLHRGTSTSHAGDGAARFEFQLNDYDNNFESVTASWGRQNIVTTSPEVRIARLASTDLTGSMRIVIGVCGSL
jgi:hypothetical protein